jgi:uncharacterized protein YecT (DUF1311 family)
MYSPRLILVCATALLLHVVPLRALEVLSFEPGGQEACSKAIQMAVPAIDDAAASLTFARKCDERDLALEKVEFDVLSRAVERGSPEGRLAFNVLMVSFTAYRDLHVADEVCKMGAACDELKDHAKAVLNRQFLGMAEAGAETVPATAGVRFTKDDCLLNAVYQAVVESLSEKCAADSHCALTDTSFREVQRAWVRYRDAWATFGPIQRPGVPADSWSDVLTRQRTEEMEMSFAGVSAADGCRENADLQTIKGGDSSKK